MKHVVLSSCDALLVKYFLNQYGLQLMRQLSVCYIHELHVDKQNILDLLNRKFNDSEKVTTK